MSALTKQAINDGVIRIVSRQAARAWRRLCMNTGKRPIMDDIFATPGFEREKLHLVVTLGHLTEELSKQDGWDSTNPDCPEHPEPKNSGVNSVDQIVKNMVEEALKTLKDAELLHGQPLFYTADGFYIDVDKALEPTITDLGKTIEDEQKQA